MLKTKHQSVNSNKELLFPFPLLAYVTHAVYSFQSESAHVCVQEGPLPSPPSVAHSNDAARATGVASADKRNGVVEGHGRVGWAELVRVIVRGRGRRKWGLRAVTLSDTHGRGHG